MCCKFHWNTFINSKCFNNSGAPNLKPGLLYKSGIVCVLIFIPISGFGHVSIHYLLYTWTHPPVTGTAPIPYLPKPLSHLLISMKITTQTCSKMKCADEDFAEFHPSISSFFESESADPRDSAVSSRFRSKKSSCDEILRSLLQAKVDISARCRLEATQADKGYASTGCSSKLE